MFDPPALAICNGRSEGVMSTNNDTLRQIATTAGLSRLDKAHLAQLKRAMDSARELSNKLPKDLHYSEEIALTFRLPAAGGSKP